MFKLDKLQDDAINLLKDLISIQSFSFEEDKTATKINNWLKERGVKSDRKVNNIIAYNKHYDQTKPNILLNSHHDTVEPNSAYTLDPYKPQIVNGKLYGLGSNDAGGALVSLITTFLHFYDKENLSHNIILLASAEEERSGPNGIKSIMPILPEIELAIVGEPTLMNIAVAEKGLIVFDLIVKGTSSHAAHKNLDNPIYKAIDIINKISKIKFEKKSNLLDDVKLTVTQINAGVQHNVVPAEVKLVLDARINDKYTNTEIYNVLKDELDCEVVPRNLDLNSSSIPENHKIIKAGNKLGFTKYGSPTLSDQAKIKCNSIKLGPGDSTRSHTADEFIYVDEIKNGVKKYIELIEEYIL
ncbi:MAG: acetylornithine deacetylase [Flavobacteriaceae bacterium]|jgi:acetylornithine deacetylase|nr:acetylornithine deacetylase [Flavobacteriaceae bacterium]